MSKKKSEKELPSDLITQSEAAELRGLSVSAIGQWVRRGRVRSFELYGRRLVSRAEVMAYDPEANKGGRGRKAGN